MGEATEAGLRCATCGLEIEDRGDPSMDGNHRPYWVHVPGGYTICYPQQPHSPKAEPGGAALRERIAAALCTTPSALVADDPPIDPGVHGETHRFHAGCALCHGEADTLAAAVLPVVQAAIAEETAQLRVERGRFRAAWLNARNRAEGFAARYRYQRKLCHDADIRSVKAIRAQLAAEADRDRLTAEVAELRARLADAEEGITAAVQHRKHAEERARKAEAAVERVRVLADEYAFSDPRWRPLARETAKVFRAALGGTGAVTERALEYGVRREHGEIIEWPSLELAQSSADSITIRGGHATLVAREVTRTDWTALDGTGEAS